MFGRTMSVINESINENDSSRFNMSRSFNLNNLTESADIADEESIYLPQIGQDKCKNEFAPRLI